ncbi:uncharacterized protein LOC107268022 [Cephus cinctus]|uniref:Uncharacterized protein LOC107268022 n=1 Tax=Cephus cinctus TaxID=211228 RepID=A0AAJ7BW68_CEPCN|nr:uncharacterized protein LOC107268022 [Cephus cinctus]
MATNMRIDCVPTRAGTMKDITLAKQDCNKFQVEYDISSEQVLLNQSFKDSPRLKKEISNCDVLALPFTEHLRYQKIRAMSIENENIYKFWKQFLCDLPHSENKFIPKINNKYWRWKNYIKYVPNENYINIKKSMSSGPKLDNVGRLPIPADELPTYRGYRNTGLLLKSKDKINNKKRS